MNLKELLNREQYEAATHIEGPLLILAGAGSGKTRVLTYRIAHMIKEKDIFPYNILAITFTNKAAGEMRERVKKLIGERAEGMWISTFHSSCVKILRREAEHMGFNSNFTIYDSYDSKALVKQCMKEIGIDEKDITDKEIIGTISKCKNELKTAMDFKKQVQDNYRKNRIADVFLLYTKRLRANNAMDFDDLIFNTVQLFEKNPEVLEFYQRKFKYIMVDEYQDTNYAQYKLVKSLAEGYNNICVVGDDDQCIYQWRGADIQNILDFEKDFKNTKVVKLEQNYRSKGAILQAANSVIKYNSKRKDKVLRTEQVLGEKLRIYRGFTDKDEAAFVAREIKKIREDSSLHYRDFAILYRMNSQSRTFEDAFRRASIPYRILGGLRFYDRKEIKDVMAYLKVINNPQDDISLQRIINVPKRAIGDATVQKIRDFAQETDECLYSAILDIDFIPGLSSRAKSSVNKFLNLMNGFIELREDMTISQIIKKILEDTGYMKALKDSKDPEDESRVENLKELVSEAVDFENNNEDKSLEAFLEQATLVSDTDNYNEEDDSVVLMTVHASKGLEFPAVFMVGMENGIFPSDACFNSNEEMEEARRLCYVAITRAEEKLYLTSAEQRMVFGRTSCHPQSDFIEEIPLNLKETVGSGNRAVNRLGANRTQTLKKEYNPHALGAKKSSYSNSAVNNSAGSKVNSKEFVPGRKIHHPKFGEGTIITAAHSGDKAMLTIAFSNMGIKKLDSSIAPLKLL
ncbi:DNA helicase PcrA [Oceanirhabdus sp. W0125-5]|uniref:DNA helicase PcrA n=1 Tax=Oceanirhabdus sp. W0125-5 TaxID=2999116 RepID=UPI0022F33428|nr:DNA helicase PcrA [Oceanirhabdus sp. W0125-5]WBW98820.1 DNA helicase PcrA [Oceanirhabdus sp. W0125-5]